MEWFGGLLVIVVIIAIGVAINSADKQKSSYRKDVLDSKIRKLPNKECFKIVFGQKNRYAFILDDKARKIYYLNTNFTKDVSFDQIISVEVLEDNTLLSSKSTTRTVGGALLGGALAGGAGMIVGGLSGDSKQKKRVSKVTVKIKHRDYSTPSLEIPCFVASELTWSDEVKSDDAADWWLYKEELKNAQKIADYVSVVIDEVDRQEKRSQTVQPISSQKSSFVDELAKLASLKEQGLLTEDEFKALKEKLLK